jgi:cephalosporin hydroxylase
MSLNQKMIKNISIDIEKERILVDMNGERVSLKFNSPEAFLIISNLWLRLGWDTKYVYSFTWLGRPIIQLPEDIIRLQEVIYKIKPDVIVETGVAHGGGLIFYSSLCKAIGKGKVIGVDIEIRPHNRKAIEAHELFEFITLIEGDSVSEEIIEIVRLQVKKNSKVIVFLDSNHSKEHVLKELNAYSSIVSVGSYIVAMDGIMENLVGAPRSQNDWAWNNPKAAAEEFVKKNKNFIIEEPEFSFNEGVVRDRITYWPSSFIRRIK